MPKNVIGSTLSTSFHGSTDYKIISPDGAFYLRQPVEAVAWTSDGLDPSTASCYGVSYITGTYGTDGGACPLTIAAPRPGCIKTVVLNTTKTSTDLPYIDLTTACGLLSVGSSGYNYINFSSLASDVQSVTLVGLTTAYWGLVAIAGSTLFWQNAAGIRSSTTPSS